MGHDPRHPRWSNTPIWRFRYPIHTRICPRANEWVQQPGGKGNGPYSYCLGVVLLLDPKPRASHDPNGVRMLTPYVIIDTSCHDVDMLEVTPGPVVYIAHPALLLCSACSSSVVVLDP